MASMYQQPPPQPNVVYMAPQQPSQGTLMPGQSITLKHYTVTVERYLSQGGFAHVYLVRSATPINGTTSHVLKRIAVSDDIMLKEVQKEVDVMKVLRGHPNIVNLIDSASFPHSNGTHEVFILMEYCAGGGIIDMMNRRLRERLTESEILTIFVEVLEGVACMHNLKPALLHRDLKVENILQASEKSYKLCDFGSAATAALKSPTTTAEIRAIEQDLLRHTTLQYRAPEMVDPYLRLPIDEKSDVWALGVLLYKLCYYTTPFEEHGPLAILNVHYKIPPYPVYSQNMINLIVSMLQKYGKDRPSVFDLLDTVHRLRGTRSQFSYRHRRPLKLSIPMPRPVSNRHGSTPASGTVTPAQTPTTSMSPTPTPSRRHPQMQQIVIPQAPPLPPLDNTYFPPSNQCVVVVQAPSPQSSRRPGDPPSRKGTYFVQQPPVMIPITKGGSSSSSSKSSNPMPAPPMRSYTYVQSPAGTDNSGSAGSLWSRDSSRSRGQAEGSRGSSPPRSSSNTSTEAKRTTSVLRKATQLPPPPQLSQADSRRPPPPSRSMTIPSNYMYAQVPVAAPPPPPPLPMLQPTPAGGRLWRRGI